MFRKRLLVYCWMLLCNFNKSSITIRIYWACSVDTLFFVHGHGLTWFLVHGHS